LIVGSLPFVKAKIAKVAETAVGTFDSIALKLVLGDGAFALGTGLGKLLQPIIGQPILKLNHFGFCKDPNFSAN
jgi:hypothetical protein